MKKLFFLSVLMLLMSSCACVLAQIPPQYVVAGAGCQAALPDYLPMIKVTDNCQVQSKTQTPAPGFMLTQVNHPVTVTFRATDVGGNFSEMTTTVTLIDNVPPVMTFDTTGFIASNWEQINLMYDIADRLVAEQEQWFDSNFDWSFIPEDLRPIDQYNKKLLVTWTSPGHATEGYGTRVITFVSPNDTFLVK